MGENIKDLDEPECFWTGLTRTISEASSSALTVNNCKNKDDSSLGEPITWTDKKHSLYLDSLEASFVEQLHQSMDLFGQHASDKLPVDNSNSEQFKVIQHGYWQKLNFKTNRSALGSVSNSHKFLRNQWIRHFKSARQDHAASSHFLVKPNLPNSYARHLSQKKYLRTYLEHKAPAQGYYHASVGSTEEFSDQNFEDGDKEGKSVSLPITKRTKAEAVADSSKDQVVPFSA